MHSLPSQSWPVVLGIVMMGCAPLARTGGLREGQLAPSIDGAASNGRSLRLSDYRGKVVLLGFWHGNCPPCRSLFGREQALVQRFEGRPFVLLGVNADESPEQLRRVQEKAKLSWVSWWDGPEGSIRAAWGVERFPSLFLVDHRGVIRWQQVGVPSKGVVESKIEELLLEASRSSS